MKKNGFTLLRQKATQGFTLIEMLVVIAIIAILAATLFGVANYSGSINRARDTKYISEIKAANKALELYFTTVNDYPNDNAAFEGLANSIYLPSNFDFSRMTYRYNILGDGGYCLCTTSEMDSITGNSSNNSCTWFNTGTYYCVINSQ
jgi:prepilin-type N-terminal cleavage/methylation domain-containing protein